MDIERSVRRSYGEADEVEVEAVFRSPAKTREEEEVEAVLEGPSRREREMRMLCFGRFTIGGGVRGAGGRCRIYDEREALVRHRTRSAILLEQAIVEGAAVDEFHLREESKCAR